MSVAYGIGIEEHDQEGRVITLEFAEFYLVTVYTRQIRRVNLQDWITVCDGKMHFFPI